MSCKSSSESKALDILQQHASHYKSKSPTVSLGKGRTSLHCGPTGGPHAAHALRLRFPPPLPRLLLEPSPTDLLLVGAVEWLSTGFPIPMPRPSLWSSTMVVSGLHDALADCKPTLRREEGKWLLPARQGQRFIIPQDCCLFHGGLLSQASSFMLWEQC